VFSVWLFANTTDLVGLVPHHHPAFGDITFEAGFIIAALVYWALFSLSHSRPEREFVVAEAVAVTAPQKA
jgi:cytosine/uracil/thiamine/allantoin permease